ncbi:hypothetical protein SKAU_G00098470 [Synaphobranchus kaupii]|uniref:Transposase n=1 Tax=Synaphobranchus kaupii TaxID=118154 RepID=A0A9Q1FXR9_SYNKA|nr:hypothetical protein SKAU_G00098470 [Synaphobranchus kaupii]
MPTIKHGGGEVMIWGSFPATGPGHLTVIEATMNSSLYQCILEENETIYPTGRKWICKFGGKWIMQDDNYPKHTSKSMTEWSEKEKGFGMAKSKSQAHCDVAEPQELNAVNALKHQRAEARIPSMLCNRLINSYRICLLEVIAAKGAKRALQATECFCMLAYFLLNNLIK